ncbi:MAG TPA: hypothetical protein DD473_20390, partial [Planctomycetaceae bacterium]|nr:hypothetical protein [Planctomycetaceae bacterium]
MVRAYRRKLCNLFELTGDAWPAYLVALVEYIVARVQLQWTLGWSIHAPKYALGITTAFESGET